MGYARVYFEKKKPQCIVTFIFFPFQPNLRLGNYAQLFSCTGMNTISVVVTGQKARDLSKNSQAFIFSSNAIYFFDIDVSNTNSKVIAARIDRQIAEKSLVGKIYQAHQTSRLSAENGVGVVN